jgi:hypothetical protein
VFRIGGVGSQVREVNWSDLQRDPKKVADIADTDGDVRVIRRDGVNLILTREDKVTRAGAGAVIAARAMRQILSGGMTEEFLDEISSSMVAEFPWLKLLPEHEILAFLREFAETMLAAAEIARWELVDQLVTQWTSTAAIHADPELAAELRRPITEDLGPIPSPGGTNDDAQAG